MHENKYFIDNKLRPIKIYILEKKISYCEGSLTLDILLSGWYQSIFFVNLEKVIDH